MQIRIVVGNTEQINHIGRLGSTARRVREKGVERML